MDTENAVGRRIKQMRRELGLGQAEMAEHLGLTKGSISAWETGIRTPDGSSLTALQHVFKVNPAWILYGEPPMWANPPAPPNTSRSPMDEYLVDRPLIVGAARCGPGGEIEDPGPNASRYALRKDFAARILSKSGGGEERDLFFLLCRGESMQPTILDKEIVLLNTAMGARLAPRAGGIYLVKRRPEDEEARVKRIRLDAERHELVLGSDNRAFLPVTVPLDDTPIQQLVLGRVVWVGRYLLETEPPEGDW